MAIGIWLVAASAAAADPALDQLERALPAGWSLLATGSELVIRHDRPCYVIGTGGAGGTGGSRPGAPPGASQGAPAEAGTRASAAGPVVTIELRYRIEPQWTAQQVGDARAANDRIDGELRTLAARYRIDAIRTSGARRVAASADEQARLDAYEAARARLTARRVHLPRCTLGDASVFDGADTYAQLALRVDPPEVMTQAHRIVELVKQHCR
ncbi:MAG TPA: hypothetical protein VHT91_10585 [Kofleriaceae bacterium]|jgi:hypothetical protein|nr:hypothetical protein [Kofleriaceae bacterium]